MYEVISWRHYLWLFGSFTFHQNLFYGCLLRLYKGKKMLNVAERRSIKEHLK